MPRLLPLLVLAAVLIALSVLVLPGRPPPGPDWQHAVAVEPPRALADFELVDHHLQRFDRERFKGGWTLVMVGFTHCPDICPTGLSQLSILQQRLAEREAELGVLFVSVDPARDTPETLADYVGFFGQDLLGATGHGDQLLRLGESLEFAWVHVPMGGGRYTVDHSGALALIDPQARLAAYFLPPFDLAAIEADLGPILARR